MRNPLHKITKEDFDQMQFDTMAIMHTFDITGEKPVQDHDIICMTTGDVSVSCVPTIVDQGEDVNGCPTGLAELQDIERWDAKASFTALSISPAVLALALGAADVSGSAVTPRAKFDVSKDFHDTWFVGIKKNGGVAAALLKKAVSTAGLSLTTTKNNKGQLACELTGHPSIEDADLDAPPIAFYSTDAYPAGKTINQEVQA